MSRSLRGNQSDASSIHAIASDAAGFEVSGADLSLSDAAGAYTLAQTVEQWLIAMQLQVNALTGSTPLVAGQLGGLWSKSDPQQERPTEPWSIDWQAGSFIKI